MQNDTPERPVASTGVGPGSRLLSLAQLADDKLLCSRAKARQIVAQPWFPPALELGPRILRWREAEVDEALARAPRRADTRTSEPAAEVA
jgi:predicted DNA-binding transcriptional regulator AlpA